MDCTPKPLLFGHFPLCFGCTWVSSRVSRAQDRANRGAKPAYKGAGRCLPMGPGASHGRRGIVLPASEGSANAAAPHRCVVYLPALLEYGPCDALKNYGVLSYGREAPVKGRVFLCKKLVTPARLRRFGHSIAEASGAHIPQSHQRTLKI